MPVAKVNGININYTVEGHGEPLVMIMGFGVDQSGWKRQVSALKDNYQVIVRKKQWVKVGKQLRQKSNTCNNDQEENSQLEGSEEAPDGVNPGCKADAKVQS